MVCNEHTIDSVKYTQYNIFLHSSVSFELSFFRSHTHTHTKNECKIV